jgi:hypothetical protein
MLPQSNDRCVSMFMKYLPFIEGRPVKYALQEQCNIIHKIIIPFILDS